MRISELRDGDLLFMRDASDMSKAIRTATGQYSHVAMYLENSIYHSTHDKGVVKQDLREFLQNDEHETFIYRYAPISIPEVKALAEQLLGRPYNKSFYPDNGTYYCSQYIAAILPIFQTIPMQFGDEQHDISDFWQNYYAELGVPVPLHQPGTNPSQLSQSDKLTALGKLDIER